MWRMIPPEPERKKLNKPLLPKILGILNVTPDSFSDGGRYNDIAAAVAAAGAMLAAGVDAIDVGGESTRPGGTEVSISEELARVIPVIEGIKAAYPEALISIDTRKGEVARAALAAGAGIINDVSMLTFDPALIEVASASGADLVIGHIRGTPETMDKFAVYKDVVKEVADELAAAASEAERIGVRCEKIILDPGLGFAKTPEQNIEILRNLDYFNNLGYRLMIGHSRKRFLGAVCGISEPLKRDMATLACSCFLAGKCDWIRVHSAIEHALAFKLLKQLDG